MMIRLSTFTLVFGLCSFAEAADLEQQEFSNPLNLSNPFTRETTLDTTLSDIGKSYLKTNDLEVTLQALGLNGTDEYGTHYVPTNSTGGIRVEVFGTDSATFGATLDQLGCKFNAAVATNHLYVESAT
jgi:hypothetical protein